LVQGLGYGPAGQPSVQTTYAALKALTGTMTSFPGVKVAVA